MSLDKRTSKTASYPVAQGYRPPPLEQKPATPGWAFPVALGAMAAFLVVGLVLLLQCLGSAPDAPSAHEELPAQLAQAPNVGGFKLGVEVTGPILVYDTPSTPRQQQGETDPPNPPPAKPVVSQRPKAEPSKPPTPPDWMPLLKVDEPKPKSADTRASVPRPRTPDDGKSYISGLPSLLPNEKAFILGPLDIPNSLKFTVARLPGDTAPKPLRLALMPPQYDDMGRLLEKLGEGYHYTQLRETDLYDLNKLRQFNVVFLTCSSDASATDLRSASVLTRYVELGGTLYASDLRYELLARAFREAANPKLALFAPQQDIRAKVTDAGLLRILGDEISLRFDAPGWRPAAFHKRTATTYLEGAIRTDAGKPVVAPLMVKFKVKKGFVIYTAFHNAVQNDDAQLKLLQYMVFSAVNAQIEARINKAMTGAGLTPRETKNLNIAAGQSLVQQTFHHAKPGKLQFAVGFEAQDAKLRLLVTSPSGDKLIHEDTGTFIVEIENAPAGEWLYTVAALETPYPNFPYALVIGESAAPKSP